MKRLHQKCGRTNLITLKPALYNTKSNYKKSNKFYVARYTKLIIYPDFRLLKRMIHLLGKRIKQLRTEQKVSLSELAERAGVAKSYLSAIERDIKTNPSIHFLEKIASVLHTSVESLIHPENEQTGEMDPEWRELVKEAMESGVSKQQFREFLEFQIWKANQDDK